MNKFVKIAAGVVGGAVVAGVAVIGGRKVVSKFRNRNSSTDAPLDEVIPVEDSTPNAPAATAAS